MRRQILFAIAVAIGVKDTLNFVILKDADL
jgi:hypothetical protein